MATEITLDLAETVADLLDGELRTDYSGRGMYGKECFAVVVDGWDPGGFVRLGRELEALTVSEMIEDSVAEALEGIALDSMGRGSVFYWPRVTVEEL